MKVKELIRKLKEIQYPDAKVLIWDPETECYEEVTGFTYDNLEVHLHSDLKE